ncbi:hypothetical protein [Mycobacterium sp.]|uniref:hypothetical protein n=1 Tax=Mycobacterium sp. TaxID=1785 RepID=UPI0025CF9478|nr:hypothetical protein [Mycobacterium sp.]
MQISKFRLLVGGILVAASFSVLGLGTAYAIQDHMVSARDDLQQALTELGQAPPDKGGHKAQAVSLIKQAIDQVNQGIQYADSHRQTDAPPASDAPAQPEAPAQSGIPGLESDFGIPGL